MALAISTAFELCPLFWNWASMSLSVLISSSYFLSNASLGSSLTRGLFLIYLARCAYRRVDNVSSQLQFAGEHAAIITVLVLPPRESCRRRVSLESRYGMCCDFPSTSELMTLPRAVNDRLILMPSFIVQPVAPVFEFLSEPARSTRFSFPALICCSPLTFSPVSMYMVKIE